MANTEYNQVLSGSGTINRSGLLAAMEKRGVYVIQDGEDPTALTPGQATTLAYRGVVFWYDSADATTVNDGITCIVTADNKRFKSDGFAGKRSRHFPVSDKDLTTPPGTPSVGDQYIVAAGATGAWAAQDKKIATWTARGWRFTAPNAYDLAYVIDESLIYHYSAGGSWTSGFPFLSIGANTVLPSMLKYGRFGLAVVNQTTNTPPVSPSDGDAYVIGGSPTGVWATHARKIAIYESSAWVIYTPYEGATVYDAGLNVHYVYDGSAWAAQASAYAAVSSVFTAARVLGSVNMSTGYGYDATTVPTTSDANEPETVPLAHTAKKSGAILEITYECVYEFNGSGNVMALSIGLQVDSNAAMTDWTSVVVPAAGITANPGCPDFFSQTFFVTTADALAHTYTPRFFARRVSGSSATNVRFGRRRIIIRERA